MRVTLDLDQLLRDGSITAEEYARLSRFARRDTGTLLVNVLGGFGVIAVAAAGIMLIPNAVTGCALGGLLMALGLGLQWSGRPQWGLFAAFSILIAALLLGGGVMLISQGITSPDAMDADVVPLIPLPLAWLAVALIFAASAVAGRSGLLAALAVLALSPMLGGWTGYTHAAYWVAITRPLATVLVFSAIALGLHGASRVLAPEWERLATIAARTALLVVNLGFWVGSLWGSERETEMVRLSPGAFSVLWAVGLIGAGVWAGRTNRRWLLNLAAIFGGIHFYTQWFEHLGADPLTILAAGLLTLGAAFLLRAANRRMEG